MSVPEVSRRLSLVLCSALLVTGGVNAGDTIEDWKAFYPRPFDASVKNGEIVGREQVRRVFVSCGTNEFVFAVPVDLRVDVRANKVTLISPDASYFLSFRIVLPADSDSGGSITDPYRRHVMDQFPDAKIVEEASQSAAGRSGPAFEMQWKAGSGPERNVRVALIPSPAGLLEWSLNADSAKVAAGRSASSYLLRTFQSNERGAIEIVRRVIDRS